MTDNDRNLLDEYKNRLQVADRVHLEKFGEHLTESEKIMTAKCLKNTQDYMQELTIALNIGNEGDEVSEDLLQLSGIKYDKEEQERLRDETKLVINLTNVVMPNLVAPYVALIYTMSAKSGYINFIRFSQNFCKHSKSKPPRHLSLSSVPLLVRSKKLGIVTYEGGDEELEKMIDDRIANGEINEEDRRDVLGAMLANKAVEQICSQIDNEVLYMIIDNAEIDEKLIWKKPLLVGASNSLTPKQSFEDVIDKGEQILYDRVEESLKNTDEYSLYNFMPTYMLISESLIPILTESCGMNERPNKFTYVKGPYVCGEYKNKTVIAVPDMPEGEFILGVNNPRKTYSAVTYDPYLPIIPTRLLGDTEENGKEEFATLYDLVFLDKTAIVAGKVI